MTRLGYQIPNFTYPGVGADTLFATVAAQAKAADASGFDTVLVMDHFYQLFMLGQPEDWMLECYSLLSALARETSNVRLGALVTGNTYRNPALLAKTVTTLDIVSEGRAQLGIGAGWFDAEHTAYGFEFGTFAERFRKLEEALQIIKPMLSGQHSTFSGRYYETVDAMNYPQPISRIPIMIGGSGEKKTLRMVAQYADESNMTSPPEEIGRKLDALAAHCADLGRDRAEITVTQHLNVCIGDSFEAAEAAVVEFLGARGFDVTAMDDATRSFVMSRLVYGDADTVGEKLASLMTAGIDGFTFSMPANGHIAENVERAGAIARKAVGI